MSKLTEKLNEFAESEEKTVVINRDEIDKILEDFDYKTVVDTPRSDSALDPELEAILRETEGYVIEPELEEEPKPKKHRHKTPSENAQRVLEQKADERAGKKKKRTIIICVAVIAVLAVVLAIGYLVKNVSADREYTKLYKQAEVYYYDGKYDDALEQLRQAMKIDKTDECLMLMSRCYEGKNDFVNAIAILQSSNSGSKEIKDRIKQLETEKANYESGRVVMICGKQVDIDTTTLDLSKQDVHSGRLGDIGKLKSLKTLKLSDNKITDLNFLSELTQLESLDLSKNEITDLTPIIALTNLRTLHIDDNPNIKDFSPLYKLSNLRMLTIGGIELKQSQLKQLKERLPDCVIYSDEASTDILDITIGNKTFKSNVTKLDLSDCGAVDISQLSLCPNVEELNLSGNYISDISPLMDMGKLRVLNLADNNVSDIRPLMSLKTLEHLSLKNNKVKSTTALSELKELRELILSGNSIDGTNNVAKLSKLKTLSLVDCGLKDENLAKLYNLTNLEKLNIENNSALTESAVNALTKKLSKCKVTHSEFAKKVQLGGKSFSPAAESVDASNLGISDISACVEFKSVKRLDLSRNSISSVKALSGLKTLESLDLSANSITDLTPLYSLTNLRTLHLEHNGLSEEALADLREALPNCTIISE